MIDALIARFNEQLLHVLRAACGEGGSWPEVVRAAGLEPGPPRTDPAPVEEVRAVLTALVTEARQALDQIAAVADPVQVAAVRQRLELVVDHEVGRYAAALERAAAEAPPPTPTSGIAAIFKNAVETYKLNPWAHMEYDRRVTITCRTCGAAQQTRREFRCEFCGGDVFTREEEA